MGKVKKIYGALLHGATLGLWDDALMAHVVETCPYSTDRRVIKAASRALLDPEVKDRNILNVICNLAIKLHAGPIPASTSPAPLDTSAALTDLNLAAVKRFAST